jgi:hypothetical protein
MKSISSTALYIINDRLGACRDSNQNQPEEGRCKCNGCGLGSCRDHRLRALCVKPIV